MIKATGLKRGSRKKQQPQQTAVMDKEDPAQRPVNVVKQPQPVPMQQPSQQTQIQQQQTQPQPQEKVQQRRRQNEETAALTTKNYRLAKELVSIELYRACPVLLNVVALCSHVVHSHFILIAFHFSQAELRVRHRDECKNVTRLTMENVSYWRLIDCSGTKRISLTSGFPHHHHR